MITSDNTLKAEISLYYDLFLPEEVDEPAPLLIAVHGYGAHKRYMMREAQAVAPDGWAIASIQGPHQHYRQTDNGYRIGFGWLSDHKPDEYVRLHHDFILRLIEKLSADGMIDTNRIYLYGFSQACALNFRFAFTHPDVLTGIIGVCGGIPGDLDTNPAYKPFEAHTLYLYGDDDEFYTQEQFTEFEQRLRKTLPNFESKLYSAKHVITEEMRDEIRNFLSD